MMQISPPKIGEIKKMPTVWDDPPKNMHESNYKAHATLMLVMEMVNRGDSKETVWNVYDEIYNNANDAYHEPKVIITSATSENKD